MSSLANFEPLWPAERTLLDADGRHSFGPKRPDMDTASEAIKLRAEFVRALILRANEKKAEFSIVGAWLVGTLNLTGRDLMQLVVISECLIEGDIVLRYANIRFIAFRGCWARTLSATQVIIQGNLNLEGFAGKEIVLNGARIEGSLLCGHVNLRNPSGDCFSARLAKIDGSVFFDESVFEGRVALRQSKIGGNLQASDACVEGEVNIDGASIGGNLVCIGARFSNPAGYALAANSINLSGDAALSRGFSTDGEVSFMGSRINGRLNCVGGQFRNREGKDSEPFGRCALNLDSIEVRSSVFLRDGFVAEGCVLFTNAILKGDCDCRDGQFSHADRVAIGFRRVSLDGTLYLGENTKVAGKLDLSGAKVANLVDHPNSWPKGGNIVLDGFVYERLLAEAPTAAASRLAWLALQPADHQGPSFRAQPWEHLIKVLREMGHPEQARLIAIAKQDRLRVAGKVPVRLLHWLYGLFSGYGYRPQRVIWTAIVTWLFCALLFWLGAHYGTMAPTNREALKDFLHCRSTAQACTDDLRFVRPFQPLVYSLDLILPVVNLQQRQDWSPIVKSASIGNVTLPLGRILQITMWLEITFGWITSGVLIAILSGLAKRD